MDNSGTLRPITKDDLEMVLGWRNDPVVRTNMISQKLISLEEHLDWYKRVERDDNVVTLIFELDNEPLGYVSFSTNKSQNISVWGFYKSPDSPKGTGLRLCQAALEFAFDVLKVRTVIGGVLEQNTVSIRLHEKLGFVEIPKNSNLLLSCPKENGLIYYALSAHETVDVI